MKYLVLAEKPSVARDYARVLGCRQKGKGFFEGDKHVVTWALGHLVTLAEPGDYDKKLKEWRMEDLPMIPQKMKLKVIRQSAHQFRIVKELAKRQDLSQCIIATDAGREGELVARWILILAGWRKPFNRLWISSQTDEAIRDGFGRLLAGRTFDPLFEAARSRAEADWLVGLNITRALTCKHNAQLTAGRVQTPTLAIISQREMEIRDFSSREYWRVRADFDSHFGIWAEGNGNHRLFGKERAEAIAEKVRGKTGSVGETTVKEKQEPPPLLYDLTELQREANRRFGFPAKKTLSLLQKLYEGHKIVTYPRTDSRYITGDMAATVAQRLESVSVDPYRRWINPLLEKREKLSKVVAANKRLVNDARVSDHHALLPTGGAVALSRLSIEEKKIFDLVVLRFIAVLYPASRYDSITAVTVVAGERFVSRGSNLKERGWKQVEKQMEPVDGEEPDVPDQSLGSLKRGDAAPVKGVRLLAGKTKPPPRYTEATLLTAMESPGKFIEAEELKESIKKGGLGTPATRADIIEKLINHDYIDREGKILTITPRGEQLLKLVPEELRSPELTAQWELRLSRIADGHEKAEGFIADIVKNTHVLVKKIRTDTAKFTAPAADKNTCPVCGKPMRMLKGRGSFSCTDRGCGYKQPIKSGREGPPGRITGPYGRSRKDSKVDRHLVDRYSDHNKSGAATLGDILESALDKKK